MMNFEENNFNNKQCMMMPLSEAYSLLFADAMMVGIIVPPQLPFIFLVMFLSGLYPAALVIAISAAGSSLAALINYWLGRLIRLGSSHDPEEAGINTNSSKLVRFIQRFWYLLTFASAIPILGAVFMVLLGYSRAGTQRLFLLMTMGHIGFWGIYGLLSL